MKVSIDIDSTQGAMVNICKAFLKETSASALISAVERAFDAASRDDSLSESDQILFNEFHERLQEFYFSWHTREQAIINRE
jgi:hypothetical protein